jgi:S-formylglutathione hydrolase FrmB
MGTSPAYGLSVFILALANLASCAAPPVPTLPPSTSTPTLQPATATMRPATLRVEKGQISSTALAGNLLGDPATREYYIYLPPGYDTSAKRYPTVYVLHWYTGDEKTFLARVRAAIDVLRSRGELGDMIFVFPDASNKLGGSFYMSSPTVGDYETYITQELLDQIDSSYRTIPDRDSRGIMGCSMGGWGTWHLALTHPELYGVAVPMEATYDTSLDRQYWEDLALSVNSSASKIKVPSDFTDLPVLPFEYRALLAWAAVGAPNPSKPPFYFDMPYKLEDGKLEIDEDVFQKVESLGSTDIQDYLAQPLRLGGVLYIENGFGDAATQARIRDFDKHLTAVGLEHDFLPIDEVHCEYEYSLAIEYLVQHLVFEPTE